MLMPVWVDVSWLTTFNLDSSASMSVSVESLSDMPARIVGAADVADLALFTEGVQRLERFPTRQRSAVGQAEADLEQALANADRARGLTGSGALLNQQTTSVCSGSVNATGGFTCRDRDYLSADIAVTERCNRFQSGLTGNIKWQIEDGTGSLSVPADDGQRDKSIRTRTHPGRRFPRTAHDGFHQTPDRRLQPERLRRRLSANQPHQEDLVMMSCLAG